MDLNHRGSHEEASRLLNDAVSRLGPQASPDAVAELGRQLAVLTPAANAPTTAADPAPADATADHRGRLRLLVAAESAGALVAAEMRFCGLPWRADVHDALLARTLGPRPVEGYRPALLEAKLDEVRAALLAAKAEAEPEIAPHHPQPGRSSAARPWGEIVARTFKLKG